jgi:hypothetical protein
MSPVDFNHDGYADLAIGVPQESTMRPSQEPFGHDGGVHVLFGSNDGITAAGNQPWNQDSRDI